MEKVYIALPVAKTENINVRLMQFITQIRNYKITVGVDIGHQIVHNRNALVNRFLKTDCEWIFFIDTDTIPPNNVLDMTKHKLDICSGYYYQWMNKKLIPLIFKRFKNGYIAHKGTPTKIKNVVEVDGVGAGCLLINRKVFKDIKKPYFLVVYNDEGLYSETEDLYFCKKAIKAGYKIHVDKMMAASHIKTVDLLEVAQWNYKLRKQKK